MSDNAPSSAPPNPRPKEPAAALPVFDFSAVRDVIAWHEPFVHSKNQSGPKCKECGFPYPCRTVVRLREIGGAS